MSKQITVGYDGSAESFEAVRWAADEAATRGDRLRIVSCCTIPITGDAITGWSASEAYVLVMEATETSLLRMRQAIAERHPELDITTEASTGPASSTLADDAGADDLIVVGASSHRGASAFWLGSTPRHLVRHAPCPVVVVRGAASRGRPDRIVVGVDGSPGSSAALRWAADEADLHSVALVVVHGWDYPYLPVDTGSSQGHDLTQVDAACVLDRAVESARERCGADVTGKLVEAAPTSALLGVVHDGDLLVLGSRGRGSLVSSLFGSTVHGVLDSAAVPVAVVRNPETEQ